MKRSFGLVMIVAAFGAQSALAHTELTATVPENGATIAAAPENVELKFSEPVRLTALTIQIGDAEEQKLGPLPSEATKEFSLPLPAALDDGRYVVSWRALSEDTHVMNGEFVFGIGEAGSVDLRIDQDVDHAAGHDDDHDGAH
jgi:methionine-rich copper-binding protein CopC